MTSWRHLTPSAVALLAIVAAGCRAGPPYSPVDVADRFWDAVRSGDHIRMQEFANGDPARLFPSNDASIDLYEIGQASVEAESATVETSLVTTGNDATLALTFSTHLVLKDREWKVNLARTRTEIFRTAFKTAMGGMAETMGEAIGEAMGAAMRSIVEGMKQGLEAAADSISRPDSTPLR